MGMIRNRGMTNLAEGDRALLWAIPDVWSFEEAATIPVAYGTVYYSLVRGCLGYAISKGSFFS